MRRDRLKPYVYKVEGAVNFALYDMLNGKFFHFSPDGSVAELREILLEKGLIFETEGIVPNKFPGDQIQQIHHYLHLRLLQVRLNGKGEDNCWKRKKKNGVTKNIKPKTLEQLQRKCQHIPIKTIRIEAEEEHRESIEIVLRNYDCQNFELYIEKGISQKRIEEYEAISNGKKIIVVEDNGKKIRDLQVGIYNFFYTRYFNPCLGHQIAIDTEGEIKCCLWSDEILGNIENDNLKDMIIQGKFDQYWEFSKCKIEVCKDCEMRHACDDCRVYALKQSGRMEAKPAYCDYDPYTGE